MSSFVSRSSEVPDVTDVLWSPAGPPEGSEQSEAETNETTGSHQPARSGSPAQVSALFDIFVSAVYADPALLQAVHTDLLSQSPLLC